MIPLTAPPNTLPDPDYQPNGYANTEQPWIRGFAAQFDEAWNTTAIAPQVWREADRRYGNTSSPLLSAERANDLYGIQDTLKFDRPITAEHAAERERLVQDQLRRQSIVDRSGLGFLGRTTAGILGGAADPVNIAFAVAPEMLLARAGLVPGAAASLIERTAYGAASGAFGNAVLTPAQAYFAGQEGREYGLGDALMDVTVGAAIGGAFPLIGAGAKRATKWYMADADRVVSAIEAAQVSPARRMAASPEVQLETLSTVLHQKLSGMPVDVSPVINALDTISATKRMEFGNWFRDSKAVDAQGVPVRVFHGTDQAFDEFDTARLGEATGARSAQQGFFFTDSPAVASSYAQPYDPYSDGNRFTAFLNRITNGGYAKANNALLRLQGKAPLEPTAGNVRPTYLSLQNPKIVDFDGAHVSDFTENKFGDFIAQAKKDGHDGVIVRNARDPGFADAVEDLAPSTLYVAFDPKQIRSSIGNDTAGMARISGEAEASFANTQHVTPRTASGDPIALQDLQTMEQTIAEAPTPAPRPGIVPQALGETTALTKELEAFAAQDNAVIETMRARKRLTKEDEAQFEQLAEIETHYKEIADARARAYECYLLDGEY